MIVDLEAVKPLRMRDLPCWLPFDAWAEGGQVVMTVDPDGEPVKRTPRSVRRMAALLRNIAKPCYMIYAAPKQGPQPVGRQSRPRGRRSKPGAMGCAPPPRGVPA